jgi:hypothetical protein
MRGWMTFGQDSPFSLQFMVVITTQNSVQQSQKIGIVLHGDDM